MQRTLGKPLIAYFHFKIGIRIDDHALGPDYIYQSMVGQRLWRYKAWDHKLTTLQNEIEKAIQEKDRATALGGVIAFSDLQERFGRRVRPRD